VDRITKLVGFELVNLEAGPSKVSLSRRHCYPWAGIPRVDGLGSWGNFPPQLVIRLSIAQLAVIVASGRAERDDILLNERVCMPEFIAAVKDVRECHGI
jgi:hypothetical protein